MAEKRTRDSKAGGGAAKAGKRSADEAARGKESAAGRGSAGGAKATAAKGGESSGGREDRVRDRAYEIWEQEGRPPGREREHWERADREVRK